jgi:hypothetical protein
MKLKKTKPWLIRFRDHLRGDVHQSTRKGSASKNQTQTHRVGLFCEHGILLSSVPFHIHLVYAELARNLAMAFFIRSTLS